MGNVEIPQVMNRGQKPDPLLTDSEKSMCKEVIEAINEEMNSVAGKKKSMTSHYLDSRPSPAVELCLTRRYEAIGFKVEVIDDVWPDTPGYGTPRWYVQVEKDE